MGASGTLAEKYGVPGIAAEEVTALGALCGCPQKAQVFVDLYNKYDALLKDRLADITARIQGKPFVK